MQRFGRLKSVDGSNTNTLMDQSGENGKVAKVDMVLTSRNQVTFKKAIPAFEKLVSSYHFYTEDVKLPERAN
jgi:hypothetical protein